MASVPWYCRLGHVALLGLVVAIGWCLPAEGAMVTEGSCASRPLVFVMQMGPGGIPWGLSLAQDRTARVMIEGKERRVRVPEEAFEKLERLLKSERLVELDESYGSPFVDRDYRVIDAWIDGRKKSVFLYSDLGDDPRRTEVARALRVWIALRDLFEFPGAIDTRAADRLLAEHKER